MTDEEKQARREARAANERAKKEAEIISVRVWMDTFKVRYTKVKDLMLELQRLQPAHNHQMTYGVDDDFVPTLTYKISSGSRYDDSETLTKESSEWEVSNIVQSIQIEIDAHNKEQDEKRQVREFIERMERNQPDLFELIKRHKHMF